MLKNLRERGGEAPIPVRRAKDSERSRCYNRKDEGRKEAFVLAEEPPVYLTLQWFDAVEEVKVSSKLLSRRWTTEITERDRLFLEKLGVPSF